MRTILVSAYACEPLKGSEQGVGWNWVLQMAKKNQVHVITRTNNKANIEAYLPFTMACNITFHYYDTGKLIRSLKKKAKGLYFYYFIWQIGIIFLIRKLAKEIHFDYSIHLTFGSMWMPTFLPLFEIPFIWGPIGGGDGEPDSFLKVLPFKERMIQYIRMVMNRTTFLNPLILIPASRARIILARTEDAGRVLPNKYKSKVRIILETAIEDEIFLLYKKQTQNDNEIRIITTGRLTPSKNIISTVKSLSYIPSSYKFSFLIIGSGNEKYKIINEISKSWRKLHIKVITEIEREKVLKELAISDIFLFPSLREGGSWALMEAMAVGLPVICLKWSGMEIITDDYSAIRLPITSPDQMPKDIAKAICYLIDNPELREKMGQAGRERIKNNFNWEAKGEFMEKIFNELEKK